MNKKLYLVVLCSAMLLLALAGGLAAAGPAGVEGAGVQAGEAIIIDHTCTDISKIPDHWLAEARKLAIHYAHTSHGSQLMAGLVPLEGLDPKYGYSVFDAGGSPPTSLNCDADTLCVYDGNPPETYITPEDYWSTTAGVSRTQSVAGTGLFDHSMWSWCGQQTSNPTTTVQLYLDTMTALEAQYPGMRFILMTGHTDGGSATLARNNDMVRQYARDHGMVLFDFADIETYDPLGGGPYDNNGEGTCTWCESFCTEHPEVCTDLPSSCSHSASLPYAELFCKLKGQAFWWMMARLAGWDGVVAGESRKTASSAVVPYDEVVTYTVVIQGLAAPPTATVAMTDTLPEGLAYIAGSLAATGGTPEDSAAPTLRWTGVLTPSPAVTVSYAARVTHGAGSATMPYTITNHAVIVAAGAAPITRTASVLVPPAMELPERLFLPLVLRQAP